MNKFKKYCEDKSELFALYGQEFYIKEELKKVLDYIMIDEKYDYHEIGEILWEEDGRNYKTSCMLMVLSRLNLITRWTSIRYWWVESDSKFVIEAIKKIDDANIYQIPQYKDDEPETVDWLDYLMAHGQYDMDIIWPVDLHFNINLNNE